MVPRRLVEKNGVIYSVRAMKYIEDKNVRMIVAGDGPERSKIVNEAHGDHRILFKGTIRHEKIPAYYKMADAILIPSITSHGIQEATSISMLEGMACGKAVICSNIGGMQEVIQNMVTGILTEEKQPYLIAKAIETINKNLNLKTKIGEKAREYVTQHHSYLTHANKTAEIYRSIQKGESH